VTILLTGGLVTLAVLLGYRYASGIDNEADVARTFVIAVLVVASSTITAILSGLRSWSARIIVAASILSLVVLVQVPALAGLLHLQSLPVRSWMMAVAAGAFSAASSFLLPRARSAAA
jgi:Ca2+-transporting ATPase